MLLLLPLLCLSVAVALAQAPFQQGKLYQIQSKDRGALVVSLQADHSLRAEKFNPANTANYWKLSELSGSWRFIHPATGLALRCAGSQVEVGENNGSDEAQLWKVEGDLLIPTNNPEWALALGEGGTLTMLPKDKALNSKAAKFAITPSAAAGFDDALTYRIHAAGQPRLVLGNSDSGENNARIVAETVNPDNRGQY